MGNHKSKERVDADVQRVASVVDVAAMRRDLLHAAAASRIHPQPPPAPIFERDVQKT